MPKKLYSWNTKRYVPLQVGDLVSLTIQESKKCKEPETGRPINCMHAVVSLVRGQRVVIKYWNRLAGFPFEDETAIAREGCMQILCHGFAVKQGDTWTRVKRV